MLLWHYTTLQDPETKYIRVREGKGGGGGGGG